MTPQERVVGGSIPSLVSIMTKKIQNNDQMLKALLKALTPLETALLRERLVTICQMTKKGIEQEPEKWQNSFVHKDIYLALVNKVEDNIGFGN